MRVAPMLQSIHDTVIPHLEADLRAVAGEDPERDPVIARAGVELGVDVIPGLVKMIDLHLGHFGHLHGALETLVELALWQGRVYAALELTDGPSRMEQTVDVLLRHFRDDIASWGLRFLREGELLVLDRSILN